jgi:hypothetical protein
MLEVTKIGNENIWTYYTFEHLMKLEISSLRQIDILFSTSGRFSF